MGGVAAGSEVANGSPFLRRTAPPTAGYDNDSREGSAAVQCLDVSVDVELDATEGPAPRQGETTIIELCETNKVGFGVAKGGADERHGTNPPPPHARSEMRPSTTAETRAPKGGANESHIHGTDTPPHAQSSRERSPPTTKSGRGEIRSARSTESLSHSSSPNTQSVRPRRTSDHGKSFVKKGAPAQQHQQWFPPIESVKRRVALATSGSQPAHNQSTAGSQGGKSIHGKSVVRKDTVSKGIISPFNAAHICWDLFVSFLLLVTLITLPLGLAFEQLSADVYYFNLTVDCIFILDIIKSFNTGYVNSDDIEVMDRYSVTKSYLLGWFIPDLCSSVPIEFILKTIGANSSEDQLVGRTTKTLKMLRLMRMAKLLRLMRVSRVFVYLRYARRLVEDKLKIPLSDATIKLSRLFIAYLVFAHWIACLFFMICRLYEFPSNSWAYKTLHLSEGEQYVGVNDEWCECIRLRSFVWREWLDSSGRDAFCLCTRCEVLQLHRTCNCSRVGSSNACRTNMLPFAPVPSRPCSGTRGPSSRRCTT